MFLRQRGTRIATALNLLRRVHLQQPRMPEQTETGRAKTGVKYVDHVARSVCKTTLIWVLALQNEVCKLGFVDPVQTVDHGQTREDPPTVADVYEFLWPTVEAAAGQLAF